MNVKPCTTSDVSGFVFCDWGFELWTFLSSSLKKNRSRKQDCSTNSCHCETNLNFWIHICKKFHHYYLWYFCNITQLYNVDCVLVIMYFLIIIFFPSSGGTRFWIYLMGYDTQFSLLSIPFLSAKSYIHSIFYKFNCRLNWVKEIY